MKFPVELLAPSAAASTAIIQSTSVMSPIGGLMDPISTMILGSLVGATVSIGLAKDRPTDTETGSVKRMFLHFGISLGCGVLCTPAAFRYWSIPFDTEFVGPAAMLISASAVGLLNLFLPVIRARAAKVFRSLK